MPFGAYLVHLSRRLTLATGLFLTFPAMTQAQEKLTGVFIASRDCEAVQSIKGAKNPGDVYLNFGHGYELLGGNKTEPTHYLLRVPGAKPEQRWAAIGCGHVVDAAAPQSETRIGQPAEGQPQYILAVSWQSAFCETKPRKPECQTQTPDRFDGSNFTLHGLWPQPNGNFYCNVSTADKANDRGGSWDRLPAVNLGTAMRRELDRVMPGTASYLERHEWTKHGTCYGKDQQRYFADALDYVRAFNASPVRELFSQSIGTELNSSEILAAFDKAFGAGAGERVRITCYNDPSDGRRMIGELTIGLSAPIARDNRLADAILAAAPTANSGCPSGVVDRVGLQ